MAKDEGSPRAPWWQGRRGEWYLVAQIVLFAVVLFGPRGSAGLRPWPAPVAQVATVAGVVLMAGGLALIFAAIFKLGPSLTPLPYPTDEGRLVERGAYAIVRHPIYGGAIAASFGWALFVQGWLTVGYAVVVAIFFDVKSRREERWLRAKFPSYAEYAKRVRKLVPFVY
jgi:protein-S-isoprenylcysteine O-methyltransferase Ste14